MEVGTVHTRWEKLKDNLHEREERWSRTNVTIVTEKSESLPEFLVITDVGNLKYMTLASAPTRSMMPADEQCYRLFIVEDLSTQVIETLGSRYNIDPHFFREQLNDNAFYNVRSAWASTPTLFASKKRRKWFRIRNVRLRYHPSEISYANARLEASKFNIVRRLDDDCNNWQYQDVPGSVVSICRTRTTIWVGEDGKNNKNPVGIVLVDPTTTQGVPLWYDRTNWLPTPDFEGPPSAPLFESSGSWYKDITQMTARYPWFESSTTADTLDLRSTVLPTIYTVCAEWFIVCQYVDTRLSQLNLMMELPIPFVARGAQIDRALRILNPWRRHIPVWRAMVNETLDEAIPAAIRLTVSSTTSQPDEAFEDIIADFKQVLQTLNELQIRVDRLSDRGNAEMQLVASREGLTESRNLARLTWLATIFVPLSFMTGLFSMTPNLGDITETVKIYFAAAVPIAVVSLVVARWGYPVFRTVAKYVYERLGRPVKQD
jgi:hypothetical protein